MSLFTLSVKIQDESRRVLAGLEAARRRALGKAGAAIRRIAQASMHRTKKAAPPGAAPSVHEGGLKKLILFAYDSSTHSEVIGPVRTGSSDTPQRLEFGIHPYMNPALDKVEPDLPGYWANSVRSS